MSSLFITLEEGYDGGTNSHWKVAMLSITPPEATAEDFADPESLRRAFRPRGAARELLGCKEPEVVLFGASGTGKSRTSLEKLYAAAQKYPGMRGAIVRKYRSTITQSAIVTFNELVRIPGDKVKFNSVEQQYNFPNGSAIVVAGLDDPTKILSTEFDIIYVQECTEIEEATWETLTTRLRWNHMPYQQLIGDCNPDSERHWIKRRANAGSLKLIQSHHKDNPLWWDEEAQEWTEGGKAYISKLMNMTGHMRERFYEGKWVGAEGLIYTEYNADVNLVDAWPFPKHWTRYLSIDFGYNNPFVCQWWAEDEDGRLYLYRELYGTNTTVEDWAHEIHELSGAEDFKAIICDHDMEDRATLERHITHSQDNCMGGNEKNQRKIPNRRQATIGADKERKSVQTGIEQVQHRLKVSGDGKPRLFFFRNALVRPDERLLVQKKPTCTVEEIDNYIWDEVKSSRLGDRTLEQPRKVDDHGMDAMRYVVRHVDARLENSGTTGVFGRSAKHSFSSGRATSGDEIIMDKMQWWKDK